jgi:hypothetical protein
LYNLSPDVGPLGGLDALQCFPVSAPPSPRSHLAITLRGLSVQDDCRKPTTTSACRAAGRGKGIQAHSLPEVHAAASLLSLGQHLVTWLPIFSGAHWCLGKSIFHLFVYRDQRRRSQWSLRHLCCGGATGNQQRIPRKPNLNIRQRRIHGKHIHITR